MHEALRYLPYLLIRIADTLIKTLTCLDTISKKRIQKGEQEQSKDFFEIIPFTLLPPAGRGWQCILQFFHDDIMALFAITFSGGIGIVLFRLTIGLKAQKRLARGRASASPRVNRVK